MVGFKRIDDGLARIKQCDTCGKRPKYKRGIVRGDWKVWQYFCEKHAASAPGAGVGEVVDSEFRIPKPRKRKVTT